ncbi:PREDICTED: uncharacterized protein LOC105154990 [Acromyrmex echinatior]|uniref:Uncharacterized protein n=1 Tax=Acromyrmex echinatior TaxID=103372 RepID=F4WA17_ACREC|nr:PREDICTED: uncharacterized protein LOC105154990 [Acromyrmex echinatior]EGI68947.1 hypothetical protein G5I_02331 [Acromyrmex echinatior]
MRSDHNMETDNTNSSVEIQIQKTLISIHGVSLKIKKELEMIKELTKENGHLRTVVNAANQTLSKKVQKMGVNVAEIIHESERNNRLESDLLNSSTSTNVTEKLDQISK